MQDLAGVFRMTLDAFRLKAFRSVAGQRKALDYEGVWYAWLARTERRASQKCGKNQTRLLNQEEQKVMQRALKRSVRFVDKEKEK